MWQYSSSRFKKLARWGEGRDWDGSQSGPRGSGDGPHLFEGEDEEFCCIKNTELSLHLLWSPTNACSQVYRWEWLSCHAACQEVSTCHSTSEDSIAGRWQSMNTWGSTLALKPQGRRHQKSKTGVSVTPQKGLISSKKFKTRIQSFHFTSFHLRFWAISLSTSIRAKVDNPPCVSLN